MLGRSGLGKKHSKINDHPSEDFPVYVILEKLMYLLKTHYKNLIKGNVFVLSSSKKN